MTVKLESPLHYLQTALNHVDYPTELLPEDVEKQPYEQLLVAVGEDSQGQEMIVQLTYLNDIVQAAARQANTELEEDPAYILQFALILPQENMANQLPELAYLCLVLNRYLPVGNWIVGPEDGLTLKHSLIREEEDMHGRVVVEVLEKLAWAAQKMEPWFTALLTQNKTLAALEVEAEQILGQGTPS